MTDFSSPAPSNANQPSGGSTGAMYRGSNPLETLPPWLERSLPWLVSGTLHLGFLLLAIFIWYVTRNALSVDDGQQIIIPSSFTDPSYSNTAGPPSPGTGGDPSRAAAQAKLKDLMKSDGWSQNDASQNIAGLLNGETSQQEIDIIARGTGGAVGSGNAGSGEGGGPISPYGTPGGSGGVAIKTNFYGTGGNATRIVYIIDHSGSMIDTFDYLKQETKRSVGNLVPLQFFNVIMVSDTASVVGDPTLQRATGEAKRNFIQKFDGYVAENANDELLAPFKEAFEKAFTMRPQLIYFLTDGRFSPELMDVVTKLNRDKKVHINTIAFVNHEASYEDQLKQLASRNGGVYHFVSTREAEGGQ